MKLELGPSRMINMGMYGNLLAAMRQECEVYAGQRDMQGYLQKWWQG
jgi:hypothetical protein